MCAFAYTGPDNASKPEEYTSLHENHRSPTISQAQCYSLHDAPDEDEYKKFYLRPGEYKGWWEQNRQDEGSHGVAMVRGSVCNRRTQIMLDSGASTSIISLDLARRLKLKMVEQAKLSVKGIGGVVTHITKKAKVKITLGHRVAYYMTIWAGNIGGGIDCLLGMDFMYSAGVRLCVREGAVELPDEERILLVGGPDYDRVPEEHAVVTQSMVGLAPGTSCTVPIINQFRRPELDLWVARGKKWVTHVISSSKRTPVAIRIVNISSENIMIPTNTIIADVVEVGFLPRVTGRFVRPKSLKYKEWQQLIYENTLSEDFARRIGEFETQEPEGPLVERHEYPVPTRILRRPWPEPGNDNIQPGKPCDKDSKEPVVMTAQVCQKGHSREPSDSTAKNTNETQEPQDDVNERLESVEQVQARFEKAMAVQAHDSPGSDKLDPTVFVREGSEELLLSELKNQLALLPELHELAPSARIEDADVGEPGVSTADQEAKLMEILKRHRQVFLGEGNALPPPARGVVCDLDVGEALPIAQRARRIPGHLLPKVYELVKRLLETGLIEFSSSPWASPIVIVMKKNGVDIRLCIDYRRVNQLLALDPYPLPLIDDLLDSLEGMLWLLSLDMASGFWAVPMSLRARLISAFICPLGHFQWTRMPFGLKNAPLIYQCLLNNALWGFVRLGPDEEAEVEDEVLEYLGLTDSGFRDEEHEGSQAPTIFEQNRHAPGTMGPVLGRSSYIDDVAYGAKTWDQLCEVLNDLLYRLRYWRISVSLPKSSFGKKSIKYLSHEVSPEGLRAIPKIAKEVSKLQFPRTLKGVQSFLGSLNYYAKFLEDFPVIASVLYELKEEQVRQGKDLDRARRAFDLLKAKIVSTPLLKHPDRLKPFSIILHANPWAVSAVLAQEHDGLLHPVRFTGRTLHDAETRYHETEKEVLALLRVLDVHYTLVVGQHLKVYTRYSVLSWLFKSRGLQGRCLQWATMLSPWSLEVIRVEKDEDGLAAILAAGITPRDKLDEIAEELVPNKVKGIPGPLISLDMLEAEYSGFVLSFDGAAKMKTKVGSAGCVLWSVPAWEVVEVKGTLLTDVTVNMAEYHGLIQGLQMAVDMGIENLVIVGDSRIVIQQVQGYINCTQPHLQLLLGQVQALKSKLASVRLLHVKREFNASADHVTSLVLRENRSVTDWGYSECELLSRLNRIHERVDRHPPAQNERMSQSDQVSSENVMPKMDTQDLDERVFAVTRARSRQQSLPIAAPDTYSTPALTEAAVVEERWRRICAQQDVEPALFDLKRFLRGDIADMDQDACKRASKVADSFVLDARGALYYVSSSTSQRPRDQQGKLRLVVPQDMRAEVLHQCHEDFQGGHQGITRTFEKVRQEFYWHGLFADVERFVKECIDCTTSKGAPQNPGPSPGNIIASRPFEVVSMDFVGPFPKTSRGNTELLLFQCSFSGYVMCKPMNTHAAQAVAEAYEEVVFRRFGASTVLRHDREPSFMSQVLRHFRDLIGTKQRATLAYRPQANGQQERSVQTIIRSVKRYVAEADQSDWDSIVERLMFALNTSFDSTRLDTPFYLVHGWDARSTLSAMVGKPPTDPDHRIAYFWRVWVQREYEYAKTWARDLQVQAKKTRAREQTETWKRLADRFKRGYEVGDSVWLYLARVRPGLSRKLAHLWHGPFRILEKDEYRCKLKVEGTGYQFYPWIHVSRLKPRALFPERPQEHAPDVPADCDFDAALLPEDSWEPDNSANEYEVEAILDVRWHQRTRVSKRVKQYLVKWKGYEEPQWEPLENLNCGQLLYEFDRSARARARFQSMQVGDDDAGEDDA